MDLNPIAALLVKEGDVAGLKQCVEYSLQPEKILQVIFNEKRYECLPSVMPFLNALLQQNKEHPLGIAILLDLLERKEPLPRILNMDFLLQQAVERNIVVDFEQNDFLEREPYYMAILQEDCIELFTLFAEEISQTIDGYDFHEIVTAYGAVQIFEAVSFRAEFFDTCFYSLLVSYTSAVCSLEKRKKYARILRRVLENNTFQTQIDKVSRGLEEREDTKKLASLLCLGYRMSKEQKELIRANKPELFAQLFSEDV